MELQNTIDLIIKLIVEISLQLSENDQMLIDFARQICSTSADLALSQADQQHQASVLNSEDQQLRYIYLKCLYEICIRSPSQLFTKVFTNGGFIDKIVRSMLAKDGCQGSKSTNFLTCFSAFSTSVNNTRRLGN